MEPQKMMRSRLMDACRRSAVSLAAAVAVVAPVPAAFADDEVAQQAAAPAAVSDSEWVRVAETDDRVLQLQVAVRRFVAEGKPDLTLASAVHVGDRSYYRDLQASLDAKDLVLFEGVKPAGLRTDIPSSTGGQIKLTEDRIRLLALLFKRAAAQSDDPDGPLSWGDLDALEDALGGHTQFSTWLDIARRDAWGHEIVVVLLEGGRDTNPQLQFDLVSLGRDNEPGGRGADADIEFSNLRPLTPEELGEVDGIQQQLARALRLRFQLDEMDESGENWRNADLSMQEIRERIIAAGGDPEPLFGQLQGTGLSGNLVGMLLRFIEILPGAPPRVKMMMIEMLGEAQDILKTGGGPIGAEVVSVILDERDEVVVGELAKVLGGEAEREGWDDLAIIYGAGHMPGIEERIADQFGYEPAETRWVAAMSLDMDRYGISPFEHRMLRLQIRRQLAAMQQQLGGS